MEVLFDVASTAYQRSDNGNFRGAEIAKIYHSMWIMVDRIVSLGNHRCSHSYVSLATRLPRNVTNIFGLDQLKTNQSAGFVG